MLCRLAVRFGTWQDQVDLGTSRDHVILRKSPASLGGSDHSAAGAHRLKTSQEYFKLKALNKIQAMEQQASKTTRVGLEPTLPEGN